MLNFIKVAALVGLVSGHSNIFSPPGRGNLKWWGYCSHGQGCRTTCDAPKAESRFNSLPRDQRKIVRRGETIPVEWLRQNHPGGFVRISMATFENSDSKEAFDSNAVKYVCYETNCQQDHHEEILGHLNGPGSQKCSTQFTIPDNLPDGPVTLQWTWYGGGVYYADKQTSFANYVSCSDMEVSGGKPYRPGRVVPEFQGGDVATSDKGQCRYWSTNSVFGCPSGAEDFNRAGCGYTGMKFGPPKEWLDAKGRPGSGGNSNENPGPVKPPTRPNGKQLKCRPRQVLG